MPRHAGGRPRSDDPRVHLVRIRLSTAELAQAESLALVAKRPLAVTLRERALAREEAPTIPRGDVAAPAIRRHS
jgi:hypothetical protein